MNIVNIHIGKLNLCYVAYIFKMGEREYLAGSCYVQLDENCIMCSNTIMLCILYGKLYLCYVAYVYNGELVSLIGN